MSTPWDDLDERLRPAVDESVATFARVRPALDAVRRDAEARLREAFGGSDLVPLFFSSRTKSIESFRAKASRMEPGGADDGPPALVFPDPMRQIADLVGVRVITTLPEENGRAANLIKRQRSQFDCRSDREKDIGSIESGTYGYSSRHLILRTIHNDVVRDFQRQLESESKPTGNYAFEVQIRTIFAHAWSEIEHDIRFKADDPRAWSPHFDRQFTATAAMLESVEHAFSDLNENYNRVRSYWDPDDEGAAPLTADRIREVWQTLLPHVDRKSRDDWAWAIELLDAHGIDTTLGLVELLQADAISDVRKALEHRYSPGPDRLLDDLLLWRFGTDHIDATAEPPNAESTQRRDSLQRRLAQMRRYRRLQQDS